MKFEIRKFTAGDLAAGHQLTRQLGWPHTLDDWSFAASIGNGHAAYANGRLIGTCFTWPLDSRAATLGLLVVSPEAQGRGLGRALLHASLAELADRAVLLHATDAAVPLYLSEGFTPAGWISQIQGVVAPDTASRNQDSAHSVVRPVSELGMEPLLALDRDATGLDRGELLNSVCAVSDGLVISVAGKPSGYALSRAFGRGVVIGPVVAASADLARSLVEHLLARYEGRFVRIDIVEGGIDATWLAHQGLECVDRVRVMTKGVWSEPTVPKIRKFALIGHAFG